MPIQQIPPDVALSRFDLASATQPAFGETVNGDALFVETGRVDGAQLFLLVDVMGHGSKTVGTMNLVRARLADATSQNQQPENLLRLLHLAVAQIWDSTLIFATASAVLFDPQTQDVIAANAGQPEPFLG